MDEGKRAEMAERATGSKDHVRYEEMDVGNVAEEIGEGAEIFFQDGSAVYASDNVNNMALPIDLARKARRQEMGHMNLVSISMETKIIILVFGHEAALDEVSEADFGCNLHRKTSPVDLEGSRGRLWAREGRKSAKKLRI